MLIGGSFARLGASLPGFRSAALSAWQAVVDRATDQTSWRDQAIGRPWAPARMLISASSGDVMTRIPRVALIGDGLVRLFAAYGKICLGLDVIFAHRDLYDATRALSESAIYLSLIDVFVIETC